MTAKILPLRRFDGSIKELSDEALLAACALGEPVALGELFDRHHQCVHGFICNLMHCDEADADDLVQSTFETVQKSARRFQGRSAVRTWILGVARNLVRHSLRSRARRREAFVALVEQLPSEGELLDERMFQHQRILLLRTAMDALTPKLREVFVLVYVQGIGGAEAAQVLGLREGAVWKRLHVARKKVLAVMGDEA